MVTKREVDNEVDIQKSADLFVTEVWALLPTYQENDILHTDQSDLELEIHSSCTLSHHGVA
jgi:hypothetical protein